MLSKNSYFLILIIICLLTSCNTDGFNRLSTKLIKNEDTGKIEEYISIKISADEQNDYFLEVKVPEGSEKAPTRFGDFLTVYRFSKGEANQYTREGLMMSKTNLSQKHDIRDYATWIDKTYTSSKGNPIFKDRSIGHEYGPNNYKTKTQTLKYIFTCSPIKPGAICFADQKEVDVIKILKPSGVIWAIEYTNMVNPVGVGDYEATVKEKFKEAEEIIENCCRIERVKRFK